MVTAINFFCLVLLSWEAKVELIIFFIICFVYFCTMKLLLMIEIPGAEINDWFCTVPLSSFLLIKNKKFDNVFVKPVP